MSRFAEAHGRTGKLGKPEVRTWALALAVEQGLLVPVPVTARALPKGASELVARVWEGFLRLLAVKWIHEHGAPTVFARDFAAAWCGVTPGQARDAISELRRIGAMQVVGRYGRARLWLPWSDP